MKQSIPSTSGCGGCSPTSCSGCGPASAIDALLPKSNIAPEAPLPTPSIGAPVEFAPAPSPLSLAASNPSTLDRVLGPPEVDPGIIAPGGGAIGAISALGTSGGALSQAPTSGACGTGGCSCSGGVGDEPSGSSSLLDTQGAGTLVDAGEVGPFAADETYLGDLTQWIPPPQGAPPTLLARLARREFLRQLLLGAAGGIGLAQAVGCKPDERAAITQQHYYRLSPTARKNVVARLERQYWKKHRARVKVATTPARPGVNFGYALDLSLCTGCRKCVYACVEENNLSQEPQVHWIRVLQLESKRGLDLHHATPYYQPKHVPEPGKTYLPVACQQCANPPCVKICPVNATWREPDGIIVVDYNWCIGCRYCMVACPYEARSFNWATPSIPKTSLNTDTHYLGNRPRMKGVVDKCTFCIQRVRKGRYPACVEACPVGARKFGDLNDPSGELQYILKKKRILVLKEELNTKPQFFYYY